MKLQQGSLQYNGQGSPNEVHWYNSLVICLCENAGKDSQRLFLEVLEVVQHSSHGKNKYLLHMSTVQSPTADVSCVNTTSKSVDTAGTNR